MLQGGRLVKRKEKKRKGDSSGYTTPVELPVCKCLFVLMQAGKVFILMQHFISDCVQSISSRTIAMASRERETAALHSSDLTRLDLTARATADVCSEIMHGTLPTPTDPRIPFWSGGNMHDSSQSLIRYCLPNTPTTQYQPYAPPLSLYPVSPDHALNKQIMRHWSKRQAASACLLD